MISLKRAFHIITLSLLATACNNKIPESVESDETKTEISNETDKNKDSIAGTYVTQADANYSGDCKISLQILKTKDGYNYTFKTKSKKLKGIAELTSDESGSKYLVLKGIKWDYYEEDISEDENDSISDSNSELEIPVDIDASYVKDTLTIQNYGNAMNSYTKIEECGRKYIQLIRK